MPTTEDLKTLTLEQLRELKEEINQVIMEVFFPVATEDFL